MYIISFIMGGIILALVSYYMSIIAIRDIGLNKKFINFFYILVSFIILDFTYLIYNRENKLIDRNIDNFAISIISFIVCIVPVIISYLLIKNRRRFRK